MSSSTSIRTTSGPTPVPSSSQFSSPQESLHILSHVLVISFFYGIFLVLYLISSMLLQRRKEHYKMEMRLFGKGVGANSGRGRKGESVAQGQLRTMRFWQITGRIMFIVISLHWGLSMSLYTINASLAPIKRIAKAYIDFCRILLMLINFLLGDLIIIHRLWIVSNRKRYMIVYPLLAVCGYVVCAIMVAWQTHTEYTTSVIASGVLGDPSWPLGLAVASASVNVYCTLVISGIIWKTSTSFGSESGDGQLKHVIVILIESAALYTLWIVPTLVMLAIRYPLWSYFLMEATELYGVTTMLISLRVGLGWAFGDTAFVSDEEKSELQWGLRFHDDGDEEDEEQVHGPRQTEGPDGVRTRASSEIYEVGRNLVQ